jgi:hypothetical protein
MRYFINLEFEIRYRIDELIIKHGLMSIDDPRVKRLFKNLAAIQESKQITFKPEVDYLISHDGAKCCPRQAPSK